MIKFTKFKSLFAERNARKFQQLHNKRLREMMTDLPAEFTNVQKKIEILGNNSWAIHHLYMKANEYKNYQEAFLYFFFYFELNIKYLIMSDMMIKNILWAISNKNHCYFSIYSESQICEIQENGDISKLIKKFCVLHGEKISKDLWKINNERNFIIHNMMKNKLVETEIKNSFKDFFSKNKNTIAAIFIFFNMILAERPKNMIQDLKKSGFNY